MARPVDSDPIFGQIRGFLEFRCPWHFNSADQAGPSMSEAPLAGLAESVLSPSCSQVEA
jgi:hypothetical protein